MSKVLRVCAAALSSPDWTNTAKAATAVSHEILPMKSSLYFGSRRGMFQTRGRARVPGLPAGMPDGSNTLALPIVSRPQFGFPHRSIKLRSAYDFFRTDERGGRPRG